MTSDLTAPLSMRKSYRIIVLKYQKMYDKLQCLKALLLHDHIQIMMHNILHILDKNRK